MKQLFWTAPTDGSSNDPNNKAEVGESTDSTQTDSTQQDKAADVSGETVNIVWYRLMSSGDNVDEQKVQDAINEYIEPLIGVTVTIKSFYDRYNLTLDLASGTEMDLFWADSSIGIDYIKDGIVMDLTDIVKDYPDLYQAIPEAVWDGSKMDGRNYYVTCYKEGFLGYDLLYPAELVEKYGWDMSAVESYKDLTPMLQDLYEDGVEYVFVPVGDSRRYLMNDAMDFIDQRLVINTENDTVNAVWLTPEFEEIVNTMYEWNQAGYINQTLASDTQFGDTEIKVELANGNMGFFQWIRTPDNVNNANLRYGAELAAFSLTDSYIQTTSNFGSAYMIHANTEKADACLKFLSLLYTDETLANLACFGIEGEHYEMVDGRVSLIEDSGYKTQGVWSVTSVNAPTLQVGESEAKKEQYEEANAAAKAAHSNGFVADYSSVETEYAAVTAVKDEYEKLLMYGFYDPEVYLPKYQEALKSAGIEKIIAEIQSQYDEFLANK